MNEGIYLSRINSQMKRIEEIIKDSGGIRDFADYKYHVGILEGLNQSLIIYKNSIKEQTNDEL